MKGSASAIRILADSLQRPQAFFWFGAIDSDRLNEWLRQNRVETCWPAVLLDLWRQTGGGDFFESETILGPFGDAELGDDVIGVNEWLRECGLAPQHHVFARGFRFGAVDVEKGDFVDLGPPSFDPGDRLEVQERFPSFDAWHLGSARGELRGRYGLT